MLRIAKVLNNNIAVVVDEQGNDCIAMGTGVAFGRKRGDLLEERAVERLFTQRVDELSGRFGTLVASIPEKYFEVAQAIVEHAKLRLGRELDDTIYLALTDHIHFAVQRARRGQALDMRLTFEIKMMYRDEFECAQTARSFIERVFEVTLPQEEAGFIAMHFVNAESGVSMDVAMETAGIIQLALETVRTALHIEFDEESLAYYRFMVHLKFFAQRVTMAGHLDEAGGLRDLQLLGMVQKQYPESYGCAEALVEAVEERCSCTIADSERMYLAMHIERLRSASAAAGVTAKGG